MSKIISVIQNKGGVGKTTSVINLGYLFSQLGRTLLIDLDSQANLSQVFDIFLENENVSRFIDTGEGIEDINAMLSIIPNSPSFEIWKRDSNNKRNLSYKLKIAIDKIKNDFEYILIDCPPSLDITLDLALYSSDYVLIMMDGHKFSMAGLENIFTEIQKIKDEDITKSLDLKVLGLIFNRYKKSNIMDQIIEKTKENYPVFDTVIRENIAIVESQAMNQSVIQYDSTCNASKDYQELFREIFREIND